MSDCFKINKYIYKDRNQCVINCTLSFKVVVKFGKQAKDNCKIRAVGNYEIALLKSVYLNGPRKVLKLTRKLYDKN